MDVELEALRRMRSCLVGIRDLDPDGVDVRLAEIDREIARLRALLDGESGPPPQVGRIELVPIGVFRAA